MVHGWGELDSLIEGQGEWGGRRMSDRKQDRERSVNLHRVEIEVALKGNSAKSIWSPLLKDYGDI